MRVSAAAGALLPDVLANRERREQVIAQPEATSEDDAKICEVRLSCRRHRPGRYGRHTRSWKEAPRPQEIEPNVCLVKNLPFSPVLFLFSFAGRLSN